MRNTILFLILGSLLCAGGATSTSNGALIGGGTGAALGALAGGIIGNQQPNQAQGRTQGALIGALAGGALGAGAGMGIGAYMDQQKADLIAQQIAVQKQQDNTLLVVLAGDSLKFASGSSALSSDGQTQLAKVAAILVKYSQDKIIIEGHTDNVGDASFNQTLSQQRADSVKNFFLVQGVPAASILASTGYGESQPVASNDTADGRAQNRRVVLKISAPSLSK
jgi:outer membrane protein OmpA-like peptidoglycan-associated protein